MSVALARAEAIEVLGIVQQVLPNAACRVVLDNGHTVLAHVAGAVRLHYIKIQPGDRVTLELSPFDLSRGRITRRRATVRKVPTKEHAL